MFIYQTNVQKEVAKFPSKIEFDTIAYRRGLLIDKKEVNAFRRLKAGYEGEQIALEYLQKYGRKDWYVIPNLWMNYFGDFECDLALFTRYKCYPLEVKNYFGDFIFKEGISTLENIQLTVNPIFQARRTSSNLKEILRKENISVPVEGSLIFTGINNFVDIQTEIPDLNIVTRTHLLHFIKQIIKEEQLHSGQPVQWFNIFPYFEKYEKASRFGPKPYSKNIISQVKKGISCAKCNQFKLKIKKYKVTCSCGYEEFRKEALLRTIHEYGILTFYEDFSLKEVLDFSDHQVSKSYMVSFLKQNFKKIGNSRYTLYSFMNKKYSLNE